MSLLPLVIFLIIFVLFFGAGLLFLASLLGPKPKQSKAKSEAYECGLNVEDFKNTQVPVKFYLTAILFILFDIEIIFMYPWAISFKNFLKEGHATYIMTVMGVFLFIFLFGFIWEIKSKALDWNK